MKDKKHWVYDITRKYNTYDQYNFCCYGDDYDYDNLYFFEVEELTNCGAYHKRIIPYLIELGLDFIDDEYSDGVGEDTIEDYIEDKCVPECEEILSIYIKKEAEIKAWLKQQNMQQEGVWSELSIYKTEVEETKYYSYDIVQQSNNLDELKKQPPIVLHNERSTEIKVTDDFFIDCQYDIVVDTLISFLQKSYPYY